MIRIRPRVLSPNGRFGSEAVMVTVTGELLLSSGKRPFSMLQFHDAVSDLPKGWRVRFAEIAAPPLLHPYDPISLIRKFAVPSFRFRLSRNYRGGFALL